MRRISTRRTTKKFNKKMHSRSVDTISQIVHSTIAINRELVLADITKKNVNTNVNVR